MNLPKANIGFTGTQQGMTEKQKETIKKMISASYDDPSEQCIGHHGDCIGADKDFHDIMMSFNTSVVIHPPINSSKRAFCKGNKVTVLSPKDYLVRNHDIVDSTEYLIACPKGFEEELRSGTWATIRYMRKEQDHTHCIIVFPDGTRSDHLDRSKIYETLSCMW